MKKLLCFILILITLLSITSCKYEYVESSKSSWMHNNDFIFMVKNVPYEMAVDAYFTYYPTDEYVIYLPRSGDFTTITGKKFTSKVSDTCHVAFHKDSHVSRIMITIEIYDENNELIITKTNFCTYVQKDTKLPDLTYVSDEFKEYWLALSIRSDKLER